MIKRDQELGQVLEDLRMKEQPVADDFTDKIWKAGYNEAVERINRNIDRIISRRMEDKQND